MSENLRCTFCESPLCLEEDYRGRDRESVWTIECESVSCGASWSAGGTLKEYPFRFRG